MTERFVKTLQYRPMVFDDVRLTQTIEQLAYSHPWNEQHFVDCLQAGFECWVCLQKGVQIGHIVLMVAVDEAQLLTVCLLPDWQGKGIGKALLKFGMDKVKYQGVNKFFLEVRPSNTQALALYNRFGFKEIGKRKDYYPGKIGREDALVLALTLR